MASLEKINIEATQSGIIHSDMAQGQADCNIKERKEETSIPEADLLKNSKPVNTPSASQDSFQPETHPLKPESVYNIDEETRMGPDVELNSAGSIIQNRIREVVSRGEGVGAKPCTTFIPDQRHLGIMGQELLKLQAEKDAGDAGIGIPVRNTENGQLQIHPVKHTMPALPMDSSSTVKSDADLSSDSVAQFAAISQEHDKYFADSEQSSVSFALSKPSAPNVVLSGTTISSSALSFIASEYAGSENSSSSPSDAASVHEESVLLASASALAFETVENLKSEQEIPAVPVQTLQDDVSIESMSLVISGEKSGAIFLAETAQGNQVSGQEETEVQDVMSSEKCVDPISSAPCVPSQVDDKDSHPEQMDLEEGNFNVECTDSARDPSLYQDFNIHKALSCSSPDLGQVGMPEDSVLSFQDEFYDGTNISASMTRDQTENVQSTKELGSLVLGESASDSFLLPPDKSLLEEDSILSAIEESSLDGQPRTKRSRRSSFNSRTDLDSKLEDEDGLQGFPAEKVFEYQWPQDGGEWYLLQEQISEYLGVKSFKRKYPDLIRRTCDKLEKDFLREKGVVTETQSDLGLTALRSDEVYDLMMKDYPEKYHEYAAVLHEREKQTISEKHKEYEVPKLEKSKMADYMKKAAKSAAEFNLHFQRERREERKAYFDLQTFLVHYPEGRYKKFLPELTKPSAYPAALIPGQFQEHYCSYTSDELRYFPLNTALYDPPKKIKNTLAQPSTSESSSDDNSEDKSGSTSEDGSQDTGSCDSDAAAATAQTVSSAPATPALAAAPAQTPGKTPGRKTNRKVTKIRTKCKKSIEPEPVKPEEDLPAEEFVPPTTESTEVQTEDRDSCCICKNAVYQGRNKKVETKMIKCSECGKIAHPSCLDLTDKMVQVISTYPWQCMECKTCVECTDPYDEDKMMFCDRCDRGYHTFCVGLRCLPTGRWECRSCKGTPATPKSRRGRMVQT